MRACKLFQHDRPIGISGWDGQWNTCWILIEMGRKPKASTYNWTDDISLFLACLHLLYLSDTGADACIYAHARFHSISNIYTWVILFFWVGKFLFFKIYDPHFHFYVYVYSPVGPAFWIFFHLPFNMSFSRIFSHYDYDNLLLINLTVWTL